MTGSLDHPISTDQEQLVAYLDGELSPDEAAQVERRLSQDDGFRQTLLRLQQAWDLLDELPQPTVDENFTKTTVEMVAVRMSEEVKKEQDRGTQHQTLWRVARAAILVASVALGFWGIRYAQQRADREIVKDLTVIENVDTYAAVDDVTFLEQLLDEGVFAESLENEDESTSEIP